MTTRSRPPHPRARPRQKRPAPLSGGTLDSRLWADFVHRDFEKNATTLDRVLPRALVAPGLMFATLLEVTRAFKRGHASQKLSFWIDGVETRELSRVLPESGDSTVAGYVNRLDRQLDGSDFTLLVADPHLFHRELWGTARRFLRGLYDCAGMPCGGVDSTFFIGRYRRTPFGIHRGQMSVMTFPVHGEKRFRIWPRGYGELYPEIQSLTDYPTHVDGSCELVGGPGDVLYWPADIWHIAEGAEAFTSTFNIGLWWDRPPLTAVLFEMSRRLAERLGNPDSRGITLRHSFASGGPLIGQMNDALHDALRLTRSVLDGPDFDLALALQSMRALSADAFRDVPPLRDDDLSSTRDCGLLRADPESRIVFTIEDGGVYVAANGHLLDAGCANDLPDLLHRISLGESIPAASTGRSSEAIECVRWLQRAGALAFQSEGGAS